MAIILSIESSSIDHVQYPIYRIYIIINYKGKHSTISIYSLSLLRNYNDGVNMNTLHTIKLQVELEMASFTKFELLMLLY